MNVLETLEQLDAAISVADEKAKISDAAMREHLLSFSFNPPGVEGDPFSPEYISAVASSYEQIAGRSMSVDNEHTSFDFQGALSRPYPYFANSSLLTADYMIQMAYLLKALRLDAGSIADMGPGWGNTTEMLARCGFDVWAVDMNTEFCRLIEARVAREGLRVHTITGDFFAVEQAPQLDGAVFFESFHHCLEHVRLLELLHRKIRDGGVIAFAGEPLVKDWHTPWGIRPDGMSAWSIRKFGWLELGFDEDYFLAALHKTGWVPEKLESPCFLPIYRATKAA